MTSPFSISATEQARLTLSITSVRLASFDAVELLKIGSRTTIVYGGRIAITESGYEIRLYIGRIGEKFGVDGLIVETRHRPGVEAQRARRDDEIGALQARISEGVFAPEVGLAVETRLAVDIGIELREMVVEIGIHADHDGGRGFPDLVGIFVGGVFRQPFLAFFAGQPDHPRGQHVHRRRPHFHEVPQVADLRLGYRLVEIAVIASRLQE